MENVVKNNRVRASDGIPIGCILYSRFTSYASFEIYNILRHVNLLTYCFQDLISLFHLLETKLENVTSIDKIGSVLDLITRRKLR